MCLCCADDGHQHRQQPYHPQSGETLVQWFSAHRHGHLHRGTCQSSTLAQPKTGVVQTSVHTPVVSQNATKPLNALGHLYPAAWPSGSPLRAVLEAFLFQIRRKEKARAGCRFAEIRAILVQTGYVLLMGRINEPGCSSVAIRNNTTTILVPFLC